jgi:hypothetical protein
MTRVLRRPMFRIGGSTEGLTSGLSRQGYAKQGSVKQSVLDRSLSDFYKGDPTIREVRDLSREVGYKPRGTNVYDFMTEMGLNLATTPSPGGILQQVAAASKDPYQRFLERKATAAEQEYGSESDMFKTLIEAGATATGEGKTYAHRDKASMVSENMDQQYDVYDQINALDPDDVEYEDDKEKLTRDLRKLKEQVSGDEFAKAQLQYWSKDENSRKLDRLIRLEIAKELDVNPETTFEENKEFAEKFIERRSEIMNDIRLGLSPTFKFATGGRVGYQAGNTVMPGAMPTNQAAMPTDQGPSPKDMGAISYEELRARLPQEISDDIVRLLANSAEALEDFAMIQTEQDINTFNKKYGVNLVLPSEG